MNIFWRWALAITVVTASGCAPGRCGPDDNTLAAERQAQAYARESAPHHRHRFNLGGPINSPAELALTLGLAIIVGIVEALIDQCE